MDIPAHIAQSVEHFLGKEEVTGSIPVVGSKIAQGVVGAEFGQQTTGSVTH